MMWKAGLREFSKLFVVVEVVEGEGVVVGGEVSCLVTAGTHSPDRQCLPLEHVVPCHSDSEHHNLFDICTAHLERCGVRRLEINVTPAPDGLADVDLLTVDNPLAVEPPP